jgi:hypothetical protein
MAHRLATTGKEERGYPKHYIHTVINASIQNFVVDIQGMLFFLFIGKGMGKWNECG